MRRALCLVLLAVGAAVAAPKKGPPPRRRDPAPPQAIEKAVRQYVKDQVEEEGSYTVEDDVLGRSWDAVLMGVRTGEMRGHGGGTVSVCADFKGSEEKSATGLDLDFVLSEVDGEWVVEEVLVHRVGKTFRFTYGAKNERVPVKAAKGSRRTAVPPGEPGE